MLIISFDAIGDNEFERMAQYPAFAELAKQSSVFRSVTSVFPTNTYPVHASVATGVMPHVHGIVSNTEPFPSRHPIWNTSESSIRAETLWQAVARKRKDTAAVLWPVTAYSKTLRCNIPEVRARPGGNQLITSLKAGGKLLQLKMVLRHGKLLGDIQNASSQSINLDNFATACMADILRENNPALALVHLTAYDTLRHKNQRDSVVVETALKAMDSNLARLLEAAGDGRDVILFSDHGMIDVHTVLTPNDLLVAEGLLRQENGGYIPGPSGCFIECCGGSAFFHAGSLDAERVEELRLHITQSEGFRRYLTGEEMRGFANAAFGFCAREGYCYEAHATEMRGQHGYPTDTPGYEVFYMARGGGIAPGVTRGGSLLDIAPLARKRLGLTQKN